MFRIAVLDDYQHLAERAAQWQRLAPVADVRFLHENVPQERLVEALEGVDGIVAMRERTPFPASILRRLPSLAVIATTGRRNDAIDLEAAEELGIVVTGTVSEAAVTSTLEHTWALLMAAARNLPLEDRHMREGGWQTSAGVLLAGKRLGIVGLGHLGQRLVPLAKAHGMIPTAWSRNLTQEVATSAGAEFVDRRTLFESSDFISVHVRLSPSSVTYVTRRDLALMKRSAILINTSRGQVLDEPALVESLRMRSIRGAALDVFEQEPLGRKHPLRNLDNVVLSPHMGYVSEESYSEYFGQVVDNLSAVLTGYRPQTVLTNQWELHRRRRPS